MNSGNSGKRFNMNNLDKELEQIGIDDRIQKAVERAEARAANQESVRSNLPSKLSGISKLKKKSRVNPFTGEPLKNQSPVNKGGSRRRRRRTAHSKRKSHRNSKRVHHTRRKHTRRHHHHSRRRHRHHRR